MVPESSPPVPPSPSPTSSTSKGGLEQLEHVEGGGGTNANDVKSPITKNHTSLGVDGAATILAQAQAQAEQSSSSSRRTPEEDKRILRLIDIYLLPTLVLVYFLQQLDKSSLSYTSVFNIIGEANLKGSQFSWLSSVVYLAQLVSTPFLSYALVRLPVGKWVFFNVLSWGICVAASAAAHNFTGFLIARMFLGVFEASIAPAFITITQMWWRRREQTYRTAIWQSSNGATQVVGSLLAFGVGHISTSSLKPYQSIFLFCGCLTIATTPIIWFFLPDSPSTAKFLQGKQRVQAIERLRDNNMGTEAKVWKWDQAREALRDPKSGLWFSLLFLAALPSGGIAAFGPLIIKGFGFDPFQSILFNMPFGALSIFSILSSAWLTNKIRLRFPVIFLLCCFPIAGVTALLKLGREPDDRGSLLAAYYTLSVYTAIQPMLYAWASLNAGGHTKKVTTTGIFFIAQCVGNVVGPLVYKPSMAPRYTPGLLVDLICWSALAVLACVTAGYLHFLNKRQAEKRVRLGKVGVVIDTSILPIEEADEARKVMEATSGRGAVVNERAFEDLTDWENEDFVYVL